MKAIEMYYSVPAAAVMLSLSTKTVLGKLKAGELGSDVVNLGSELRPDYRIPASGINAYLNSRRLFSERAHEPPIAARSVGELRRKSAATTSG